MSFISSLETMESVVLDLTHIFYKHHQLPTAVNALNISTNSHAFEFPSNSKVVIID